MEVVSGQLGGCFNTPNTNLMLTDSDRSKYLTDCVLNWVNRAHLSQWICTHCVLGVVRKPLGSQGKLDKGGDIEIVRVVHVVRSAGVLGAAS